MLRRRGSPLRPKPDEEKEKSPDTTPGFFNTFFGWGTTPNNFRLPDPGFSSCHQCWGHALGNIYASEIVNHTHVHTTATLVFLGFFKVVKKWQTQLDQNLAKFLDTILYIAQLKMVSKEVE